MKFYYYENGIIKGYSRTLSFLVTNDEEIANLNEMDKEEKTKCWMKKLTIN